MVVLTGTTVVLIVALVLDKTEAVLELLLLLPVVELELELELELDTEDPETVRGPR